jgi:hypothetical protein
VRALGDPSFLLSPPWKQKQIAREPLHLRHIAASKNTAAYPPRNLNGFGFFVADFSSKSKTMPSVFGQCEGAGKRLHYVGLRRFMSEKQKCATSFREAQVKTFP